MATVDEFLEAWAEAERNTDAARTAAMLTDDFLGIGPLGFELPREAWLSRLSSGELHYDALSLDEVRVRKYPQSALVNDRWNVRGTARGHPMPTARVTLALVRNSDEWQLAGIHYSFIAGAPGAPPLPEAS
jgi:ketosteroid isomerase-like protein